LEQPHAAHWSNVYLGLVAVSTGQVKGSPNMLLAKVLLEKGESSTVLGYFALVKNFWVNDGGKLADWTTVVQGGGVPAFGANLAY
jgi:hypothetical protein